MKMHLHLIFVLSLVCAAPSAQAQEYFGRFLDAIRGVFVEAKPRPLFKLENDFRFDDPNGLRWIAPAGAAVDGASIPQFFWSFIGGPFEGPYINASVIHDQYCRTKERTAHDTHRNFYYGMRASAVPEWKANFMYWAVATFGPDWTIQRRVAIKQECTKMALGQNPVCTAIPVEEVALVVSPAVDLADPKVLAMALSKATAVARTLRTSNGKVLDVTATGQVLASPEDIEASSLAYRRIFESKEFVSSPARLGLLSQPAKGDLGNVEPWTANRIPHLAEAVVLTPETVPQVEAKAPFKLDHRSEDLLRDRVDLKALGTSIQIRSVR